MSDKILESIFFDDRLWADVIEHGVERHIPAYCLEKLQDPHGRADLCVSLARGAYAIKPPHTGYAKKDDGGERVFFANESLDRMILNAIYKWLMVNEKGRVHPLCVSYQSGLGIGGVVRELVNEISKRIDELGKTDRHKIIGRKFDIHKYFDTIPRECIHSELNLVEEHHGASSVVRLLRDYYNSDVYYDSRKNKFVEEYKGIKQGCAVSSWLANVILYPLDELMAKRTGIYCRYSDDIIYIGEDYEDATAAIRKCLSGLGMTLNEQKTEDICAGNFVRFLGFDIRGKEITLSKKWVKRFEDDIARLTVRNKKLIEKVRKLRQAHADDMDTKLNQVLQKVVRDVNRKLYYGDGHHSWASLVLYAVNSIDDIKVLDRYCLDALRAVYTGKTNIGGLGKHKSGGIERGKGKNVAENKRVTAHLGTLERYCSISAMKNVVRNKWLCRTLVYDALAKEPAGIFGQVQPDERQPIETLEALYEKYLTSRPDKAKFDSFYALPLEEMSHEQLIAGCERFGACEELKDWLTHHAVADDFFADGQWYWQSSKYPQLVLLKKWF